MAKEAVEADREYLEKLRRRFGKGVLRSKRKALGLSQAQMGKRIGLDQSRISRIERGDCPKDLATALAIADGYELDPRQTEEWLYLFSGIGSGDLSSPALVGIAPISESGWRTVQQIVRTCLSAIDQTTYGPAQRAGIPLNIIQESIKEEIPLDEEDAMKLCDAIHSEMNLLDRRVFIKALGLLPLAGLRSFAMGDLEANRSADPLLEAYTSFVQTAYRTRIEGDSELAAEFANSHAAQIERVSRNGLFAKERPAFLRILADLLYQQGWGLSETSSIDEIWTSKTGFFARLQRLKQEFNYARFGVMANSFLGDAYYITGEDGKAIRQFAHALAGVEDVEHKLTILLSRAKIWARQNERQKFEETKTEIIKLIDAGQITNLEMLSIAYGNLARAQALLGLEDAYRSLEDLKDTHVRMRIENQTVPLRKAQLMREELEVITHLDPTGHYNYLEAQVNEALHLAQQCKCERLVHRIQDLLEQTLG